MHIHSHQAGIRITDERTIIIGWIRGGQGCGLAENCSKKKCPKQKFLEKPTLSGNSPKKLEVAGDPMVCGSFLCLPEMAFHKSGQILTTFYWHFLAKPTPHLVIHQIVIIGPFGLQNISGKHLPCKEESIFQFL